MVDAPGGGGYLPRRCRMSGRLTPAAATRTSTSPSAGAGTSLWTSRNTSGPPGSTISIACIEDGAIDFSSVRGRRLTVDAAAPVRQIVACQPAAQAVEVRKQDALVDIRLIEFVPDLPLQRRGHDNPPAQLRMLPEPVAHSRGWTGHQRKELELVEDPLVDRRGFHEHEER